MNYNQIYNKDCIQEMKKLESNSIDAILTDPPYGTNYKKVQGDESLEVYLRFLEESYKILKEGSFCISFCFPLSVPELIKKAREVGYTYRNLNHSDIIVMICFLFFQKEKLKKEDISKILFISF